MNALTNQPLKNFFTHVPSRQNERYRYTDCEAIINKQFASAKHLLCEDSLESILNQYRFRDQQSILLVFVNGYFNVSLSEIAKLPEGIIACHLKDALEKHGELIQKYPSEKIDALQFPFAQLNNDHWLDGMFFYVPDHMQVTVPIHALFLVKDSEGFIANTRNQIVIGENAKLILVEEYSSSSQQEYLMNSMTTIHLQKSAQLEFYKIQQEGDKASHLAATFVYQQENSHLDWANFSLGAAFSRDDLVIKLQEPGATCNTMGFYRASEDKQYVDNHIEIEHFAPHTQSTMLYKGILDAQTKAVFNGRLWVDQKAQKITAYQGNHNLLLSNNAEIYSKPELEIYADDVKCKHGATIGELNQEALFYLRSRGLDEGDARRMLLQGFVEEIMQRINQPEIKSWLLEKLC